MDERDARLFVRAFFTLDPDERVEILREHELVETGYVPDRADELRNWYRAALNRAKYDGKLESVREDVFERLEEREPDPASEVGILVASGRADTDPEYPT